MHVHTNFGDWLPGGDLTDAVLAAEGSPDHARHGPELLDHPRNVADVVGGRPGRRKGLPQFVVRSLHRVHAGHPVAVGVDALRQPLEAPADSGEIPSEVTEMRSAGRGHEGARQQPVKLCANVGDSFGLRRGWRSGQCHLHLM